MTTQVIAIVNQKGGAGKTTMSLKPLRSAVREKPPPFTLIGLPQPVLHRDVPTLAADYGHVVIASPPRNYEATRSAIAAADLVLIPVQSSGADFWAGRETIKLAEEACARGRGLPVPG